MPLRDHFRPPLEHRRSWDELLGAWPTVMVMALNKTLPPAFVAGPHIQLATQREEEVTLTQDEYEVLIHDTHHDRRLVAAVEIVSPANKDRPDHRRVFVAKCAALLRQRVSVALVDVVTTRQSNLYNELLELIGQALASKPMPLYAAVCRLTREEESRRLETWENSLAVGQPLPTLPL